MWPAQIDEARNVLGVSAVKGQTEAIVSAILAPPL